MFFGKSRQRKSNVVDSPEYNEYIETDNLQDALDLFERMKKHGFESAGGMSRLRWSNGTDTFDFKKPFGPGVEAYDIPQEEYDRLMTLLEGLDNEPKDSLEQMSKYLREYLSDNEHNIAELGYDNKTMRDKIAMAEEAIANFDSLDNDEGALDEELNSIFEINNVPKQVTMTCEDYAQGDTALREYLEKILGNGQHDYDDLVTVEKDFYNEDESKDTDVSGLAKSITQQDLGRTFDKEEE